MTKVLVFNGPPGSGKDAAARALLNDNDIRTSYVTIFRRFSHPLKLAWSAFLGAKIDQFGNSSLEVDKDKPLCINGEYMPTTYRKLQIALSEEIAKKHFNTEVFGHLLVQYVQNAEIQAVRNGWSKQDEGSLVLIPDSGFLSELRPVVAAFGAANVAVIQLYREGTSYNNDSRGYIDADLLGVRVRRVMNDSSLLDLLNNIKRELRGWL